MPTPKINIVYDIDRETDMFLRFLNNPEYPQHKKMIFRAHPTLEKRLLETKTEKLQHEVIKKYIKKNKEKNKEKIEKIITQAQNTLNKNYKCLLDNLAESMDYKWTDNEDDFTVIPTLLPFCPFEKNTFYFSILSYLYNKINVDHILFTAAHEISHFLLFRIIYKNKINIKRETRQTLQEVLAPVLMNQEGLVKIIKHDKDNYFGNTDISLLYIRNKQGNKERLVTSFQNIYKKMKEDNKSFLDILHTYIKILEELKDDLENKKNLWNKNGHIIIKDKILNKEYLKPMQIKSWEFVIPG